MFKPIIFVVLLLICILENVTSSVNQEAKLDLSRVAKELWEADVHAGHVNTHYKLNFQGKPTEACDKSPLFIMFNESQLRKFSTVDAFLNLGQIYHRDLEVTEHFTEADKKLIVKFVDECLKTEIMKIMMKYLKKINPAYNTVEVVKAYLLKIWFSLYKRTKSDDSSGFEHVFLGEVRRQEVTGFHNWIRYAKLEQMERMKYCGSKYHYKELFSSFRFIWKEKFLKNIGSMLFGVSPEFEMALYTLVYTLDQGNQPINIDGLKFTVVCHDMQGKIGTCYPS